MDIINLKPIIREALAELNIPVVPIFYNGTSQKYITFNTLSDGEDLFADDEAIGASQSINIHLYYNEDYVSVLNIIKRNLKNAGFYDINLLYETYETDTELFHITLSAVYEY